MFVILSQLQDIITDEYTVNEVRKKTKQAWGFLRHFSMFVHPLLFLTVIHGS